MGHDQVEVLTEPIGMTGTGRQDMSICFAGSGDGRNLFAAITAVACGEIEKRRPSFKKVHFTVLDLKPAAMARLLILFNMMVQIDDQISNEGPRIADHFLAMAYIFSCQIIPPFVKAKLQSNISELIKKLEGEDADIQFIYVRDHDRKPIIRILRHWQQPWDGMPKVADVRIFIKQKRMEGGMRAASFFGQKIEHGPEAERRDFYKFTTLLPPVLVAKRREPSIVDALGGYRSTGKSKRLLNHIDSNWKINNTLLNYDFANRHREQGDDESHPLDFDPLEVVELMGIMDPTANPNISSIEKLADVFRSFSVCTLTLGEQKRLVVEVVVGEMADIMERIRYNLLDYRLSRGARGTLDPTTFPQTFDSIHMSNIP